MPPPAHPSRAQPQRLDARVNSPIPTTNTRFRPYRSASRPPPGTRKIEDPREPRARLDSANVGQRAGTAEQAASSRRHPFPQAGVIRNHRRRDRSVSSLSPKRSTPLHSNDDQQPVGSTCYRRRPSGRPKKRPVSSDAKKRATGIRSAHTSRDIPGQLRWARGPCRDFRAATRLPAWPRAPWHGRARRPWGTRADACLVQ